MEPCPASILWPIRNSVRYCTPGLLDFLTFCIQSQEKRISFFATWEDLAGLFIENCQLLVIKIIKRPDYRDPGKWTVRPSCCFFEITRHANIFKWISPAVVIWWVIHRPNHTLSISSLIQTSHAPLLANSAFQSNLPAWVHGLDIPRSYAVHCLLYIGLCFHHHSTEQQAILSINGRFFIAEECSPVHQRDGRIALQLAGAFIFQCRYFYFFIGINPASPRKVLAAEYLSGLLPSFSNGLFFPELSLWPFILGEPQGMAHGFIELRCSFTMSRGWETMKDL